MQMRVLTSVADRVDVTVNVNNVYNIALGKIYSANARCEAPHPLVVSIQFKTVNGDVSA